MAGEHYASATYLNEYVQLVISTVYFNVDAFSAIPGKP
jgi:hypothetical protein